MINNLTKPEIKNCLQEIANNCLDELIWSCAGNINLVGTVKALEFEFVLMLNSALEQHPTLRLLLGCDFEHKQALLKEFFDQSIGLLYFDEDWHNEDDFHEASEQMEPNLNKYLSAAQEISKNSRLDDEEAEAVLELIQESKAA